MVTMEKQEMSIPKEIHVAQSLMSDDECSAPSTPALDCPPSMADTEESQTRTRTKKRILFGASIVMFLFLYLLQREANEQPTILDDIRESLDELLPDVNLTFPTFDESVFESLMHKSDEKKEEMIGRKLASQGAQANYPIVIVPGFVTSGLEVWKGKPCWTMKRGNNFRQRIWTALTGATSFLIERDCWKEHMQLDPFTGSDPEGIKVRSAEGFSAADYFFTSFFMNYWVWDKIVENLAEVGYTPSNMVMKAYDWRLPFSLLEERDGYFTDLKSKIEALHKLTGKKVVLTSHSMGAMVVHHFFGWVSQQGGSDWVDKHIHAYVNIAGSHLGVAKAATALMSGEMSDTIFSKHMASVMENFFGRKLRRELWSTWGSLWAMLPKGGNKVYGPGADLCSERSNCDVFCPKSEDAVSPLVAMSDTLDTSRYNKTSEIADEFVLRQSHDTEELVDFLRAFGSGKGPNTAGAKFQSQYGKEKDKRKTWYDATRTPLPRAPNLKIFCLYGTGVPTERAYFYRRNILTRDKADKGDEKLVLGDPAIVIDTDAEKGINVTHGIKYSDGDGSVPLISLGYMCADAWKRKDSGLNPSGSPVFTREFRHRPEFRVVDPMRSGPTGSDHVDILGNTDLNEDLIRIATGFGVDQVESDRIFSDIKSVAKRINAHPHGGLFRKKSIASILKRIDAST